MEENGLCRFLGFVIPMGKGIVEDCLKDAGSVTAVSKPEVELEN